MVPTEGEGPLERTVAANFERFDGLDQLDNAPSSVYPPGSGRDPITTGPGTADYGWQLGSYPRPGQLGQPNGQTYTPGPLTGLTNTLGGQPLPVADWRFPHHDYTPAHTPQTSQWRMGVGQAYQGVAQTVALGDITNNPPQADSLENILRGWG